MRHIKSSETINATPSRLYAITVVVCLSPFTSSDTMHGEKMTNAQEALGSGSV
jgi:hypothetical protein